MSQNKTMDEAQAIALAKKLKKNWFENDVTVQCHPVLIESEFGDHWRVNVVVQEPNHDLTCSHSQLTVQVSKPILDDGHNVYMSVVAVKEAFTFGRKRERETIRQKVLSSATQVLGNILDKAI